MVTRVLTMRTKRGPHVCFEIFGIDAILTNKQTNEAQGAPQQRGRFTEKERKNMLPLGQTPPRCEA